MSPIIGQIDYGDRGRVEVVDDGPALAQAAALKVLIAMQDAIRRSGIASLALSGGSTPKQMGARFADSENKHQPDWRQIEIFWGDERWVPLEHPDSNAGEAMRGYLNALAQDPARIHPFETEGISPDQSASEYEARIRSIVPAPVGTPVFDLILLGMGDDGHTASLFPGTAAIHERERLVLAHHIPKLKADRITFTPPLINAAREVVFLAGGASKAARLSEVLDGPIDLDRLPAQVVRPTSGGLTWLVDRAAAAALKRDLVIA